MRYRDKMLKLNLPAYDYTLKKAGNDLHIYDPLRKKYLLLTPEEWVRQHFLHYLRNTKAVPGKLIKQEASVNYHGLTKWRIFWSIAALWHLYS